ncbi:MAG TPA: AI-2E family transporter [Gemmatimonadales bacterium]|nr:AI-2E family transporter [Gemmatimonadales bacterium]
MTSPPPVPPSRREARVLAALVVAVTLAFAWILRPYFGVILWGTVLAIVFAPLERRLRRAMPRRPALAALLTLLIIVLLVLLPLVLVAASLVQEGMGLYQRIQSGELDLARWLQGVFDALPGWATRLLERAGLGDLAAVQARLSALLSRSAQWLATQALGFGQNTLSFGVNTIIMLYLLFFLLRDGDALAERIRAAVPLTPTQRRRLVEGFVVVTRATVKGSLVVALVQGALGGLMFWFLDIHAPVLWGVVMALMSLLPAIGAPVVWLPVAVYLYATGSTWQAVLLAVYGALVIGSADNILRPLLVGRDTRIPDYVVLLSTLGGIAVLGLNGFVVGPVIAAMFMTVWDLYSSSRSPALPADEAAPPA